MGNIGNYNETNGNPTLVRIDDRQWGSIQNLLRLQEHEVDKQDGLVDGIVIMTELKISKKTLANMISCGKITSEMYVIGVNGIKKFYYKKVLGIEK